MTHCSKKLPGLPAPCVGWRHASVRSTQTPSRGESHSRWPGGKLRAQVEFTEYRAAPHPLLLVYQAERKHLTDVCRVTIAAGIEERRVNLAEHLGGMIADVMQAVLDDLDLTDFQRDAAREAVPRQLRALAGGLSQEIA